MTSATSRRLAAALDQATGGPALVPPSRTRQAVVVARDPAARTCSIQLGGNADVTLSDVDFLNSNYVPQVGDLVWVDHTGPRLLVVGAQDTLGPPAAKLIRTTNGSIVNNTSTAFPFTVAGGGVVVIDNDSMVDLVAQDTRITIQWPGRYDTGATVQWGTTAGTGRRICSVRKNGVDYIARTLVNPPASATDPTQNCSSGPVDLQEGDYIELVVFQSSGVGIDVVYTAEFSPTLWAAWHSPTLT